MNMTIDSPFLLLGECGQTKDLNVCDAEIIETQIVVLGKAIDFRIAVSNEEAILTDIVPLARSICDELNVALDMEVGCEIATNLRKLYLFMNTHLNEANVKQDPQRINEVITLLEELNKGWKEIS
jgi:flagellin-specific chaperone FliS